MLRYWREIGALLLAGGVLVVGAGVLYIAYRQAYTWTHPPRNPVSQTPESGYGLVNWEEVAFTTADGLELKGWFIAPNPEDAAKADGATVIMVHGLGGNRSALASRAAILTRHGYNTLLYDARGHGESDGEMTTLGYNEVEDVRAALAYLQTRDDVDMEKVAGLGISLGGATVIRAAARIPELRVVVAESSYKSIPSNADHIISLYTGRQAFPLAQWFVDVVTGVPVSQVNSLEDLPKIAPRPVLLVHGEQDEVIFPDNSREMYEVAGEPKALFMVPGAGHGDIIAVDADGYEAQVVAFLDEHLRGD